MFLFSAAGADETLEGGEEEFDEDGKRMITYEVGIVKSQSVTSDQFAIMMIILMNN